MQIFQMSNLNMSIYPVASLWEINLSMTNLFGANFSWSNLSGADFSGANLSSANLSNAYLLKSILFNTNLSSTDLSNSDLSSAYLEGANLHHSNFTDSNLSNADLSRTQAASTDFCRATLTRSCIKDWNINIQTNLENVQCDYVYLKRVYSAQKIYKWMFTERRPHDPNKIFAPREFTKLFQKVYETVDLIFSEGLDWQAFLVSFNKLQIECNSDELSINSFENKGNGAFVIRVNVPDNADKAEIEKYLKKQYQLEATVEAQQRELTNLYEVTKLLAGRSMNITNQASGNSYNQSGNFGIGHNEGTISGNAKVAGTYNEAEQQNLVQAAEIQKLLDQLQQTNNITLATAQQQTAKDLATKANKDPELKEKLINLSKFISENSAKTLIGEGVKEVLKLLLWMLT